MAWRFLYGCPPSSSESWSPVWPQWVGKRREDSPLSCGETMAGRPGWWLEPVARASRRRPLVGIRKQREGALHVLGMASPLTLGDHMAQAFGPLRGHGFRILEGRKEQGGGGKDPSEGKRRHPSSLGARAVRLVPPGASEPHRGVTKAGGHQFPKKTSRFPESKFQEIPRGPGESPGEAKSPCVGFPQMYGSHKIPRWATKYGA